MRLLPRPDFQSAFQSAILRAALLGCSAACALGCMQATQTYALVLHPQNGAPSAPSGTDSASTPGPHDVPRDAAPGMVGSLSVERIEGGQHLVVLQLEQLPPPERIAPGLREFVVWLEDPRGGEVNLGTLRYDRANHSGNLLATTGLSAFTVRVTGERDARAVEPAGVLLAERRVVTN